MPRIPMITLARLAASFATGLARLTAAFLIGSAGLVAVCVALGSLSQ